MASQNGNGPVVELLLVKGKADPNKRDENGWTPLHQASDKGHIAVVRLLLRGGAERSLETTDPPGYDAAEMARFNDHDAIAQLLGNY